VELAHAPEARGGETSRAGKRGPEVARQPVDHRIAPSAPGLLLADGLADVPVQRHEFPVDGARSRQPCTVDAAPQILDETVVVELSGGVGVVTG